MDRLEWWLIGGSIIIVATALGYAFGKLLEWDERRLGVRCSTDYALGWGWGIFGAAAVGVVVGFGCATLKDKKPEHKKIEYSLVIPGQTVEGRFFLGSGEVHSEMKWEVYQETAQGIYERKWIDNYKIMIDPTITDASKVYLEWDEQTSVLGFADTTHDSSERMLHVAPSVITRELTGLELH